MQMAHSGHVDEGKLFSHRASQISRGHPLNEDIRYTLLS